MDSQHSDKRIKLFLERSIDRLPFDITQKAEEIYLPDGDPAEKLKRKIKAITDAAGDNYDQFTENVVSPEDQQAQELEALQEPAVATEQTQAATSDNNTNTESALIPATNAAATAAANARVTSPQGIYIKLWHAQSEIGMALDALNIIISSYQSTSGSASAGGSVATLSNPNAPPTALPPGSLKCEYVPRAVLPLSAQIANEKLALGGKKHHLRSAADILMQGAKKLKKVMADEDQFWAGALRLRKNNWCIVSAKVGAGPGQQQQQQHLFVHYGFRDVGSLYPERAYAELVRNQTVSSDVMDTGRTKSIQLHIPNKSNKVVIMSLVQQGEPHYQGCRGSKLKNKHTLHCQLLEAQSTLFDGELFHELVNEARSMTNSVSIVNNEIFLPINDELELKIAYRSPTPEDLALSLPPSSVQQLSSAKVKSLEETADILRCVMQLFQHRRHRQNIKERSDSFFKSSRPGGGRTAGSFGQIQQTLQQRPTNMLCMTLQALQYYTFSRRIREVLGRVTKNLRQTWWEPISVHSVDIKSPPPATSSLSSSAATTGASRSSKAGYAPSYGMGSSISISIGSKAPAIRFVLRSHPAPCAVLQLVDRPSAPIMHVTQFEQLLEEELADRAIGRICESVNSIEDWSDSMAGLQRPKFEIDIEKRCVGVFEITQRNGSASAKTVKVFLRLDMKAERAISIALTSSQGGHSRTRRIYLEDQRLQGMQEGQPGHNNAVSIHPHDEASVTGASAISRPTTREQGWSMEGFRTWLKQNIISELENW
ncbi:RNA polymerase II mediator complex subunit [Mortierella alpina]|nr:RNA polymerase II mediator complex subunit [Mortierella alpina]